MALDITEIDGFDDLHDARGILKEAEARFPAMRFSYWIEDALKFFREG